ncbi:MAG: prepilin peptidase [Chloroflexi bacterium]|nr:prepilin peptidase [Chloroflexota bacterium]
MQLDGVLVDLAVFGLVAVASALDVRARRIPNVLTLPAALLGLILNGLMYGQAGLLSSGLGWLLAVGVLLVPFAMRWLGAGDVKLVAALGALKGPDFVLATIVYAAVAGGAVALVVLVRQRRLIAAGRYLAIFWNKPAESVHATPAGSIPYAPVIAFGAAVAWAFGVWGLGFGVGE